VDHERLGQLARQLDLSLEGALLVGARRAVAIEVQTGLADRDAALVHCERLQLCEVGLIEAGCGVGMTPDSGEHLWERLGDRQRRAAGRAIDPDRQQPLDAGLRGGGHDRGGLPLAHVDVRVGIDHDRNPGRRTRVTFMPCPLESRLRSLCSRSS